MPLILCAFLLAPPVPLRTIAAKNVAAFQKAVLRKDFAWFEKTYAKDFVQKSDGQATSRAVALAQLKHGLLKMNVRTLTGKLLAVKPKGKGYVATVAFTGTMIAGISGAPATLTAKWKDDQTWTPVGKGWSLRSLATREFTREIVPD